MYDVSDMPLKMVSRYGSHAATTEAGAKVPSFAAPVPSGGGVPDSFDVLNCCFRFRNGASVSTAADDIGSGDGEREESASAAPSLPASTAAATSACPMRGMWEVTSVAGSCATAVAIVVSDAASRFRFVGVVSVWPSG